jgi:hypothetical protein
LNTIAADSGPRIQRHRRLTLPQRWAAPKLRIVERAPAGPRSPADCRSRRRGRLRTRGRDVSWLHGIYRVALATPL